MPVGSPEGWVAAGTRVAALPGLKIVCACRPVPFVVEEVSAAALPRRCAQSLAPCGDVRVFGWGRWFSGMGVGWVLGPGFRLLWLVREVGLLGAFFGLLMGAFPLWLRAGMFLYGVGLWVFVWSSFPEACARGAPVPGWWYALVFLLSGGGAALLLLLLRLRV